MSYKPSYLTTKRLPSYMGFLVLLVALGVTVLLSRNTLIFVSKATVGSQPKNIQISNVAADHFTISYTTDALATGTVGYGSDANTTGIALDDRDKEASAPAEHQVHFITIDKLTPATTYYYIIQSGDQRADANGQPFQVQTAPASTAASTTPSTLSGTVAMDDNSVPTEGLVYVTSDGVQQLAALIKQDGSYQIPLTDIRNSAFSDNANLQPSTVLQLQAMTSTEQSTAKVLNSQADQVPKIVLSQNYDFTLSPDPISSNSAQIASNSSLPVFNTPAPVSAPEITSPTDAQTYKDQKPTFTGRALPNADIDITIQSQQEITAKLQSDNTGSWQFKAPVALDPGKHTVTIKSLDASGILQTVSRSFTVYAAGSQFIEPSVSPIQVASASPTLEPSPTASPSPTLEATPTVASASPTLPPASGPMAPTGSSAIVNGLIAAVTAIGIGALLFIFTAI